MHSALQANHLPFRYVAVIKSRHWLKFLEMVFRNNKAETHDRHDSWAERRAKLEEEADLATHPDR